VQATSGTWCKPYPNFFIRHSLAKIVVELGKSVKTGKTERKGVFVVTLYERESLKAAL